MGKSRSMAPTWWETYQKIEKQGYVWIKTESGFITKDDIPNNFTLRTVWYNISLTQKDYGKTFALTKEEGFSIELAKEYLSKDSSFALYDSSRYKLLMELDKENYNKWFKMLKESLKYDAILAVDYYNKHKDDQIFYPFLNNY